MITLTKPWTSEWGTVYPVGTVFILSRVISGIDSFKVYAWATTEGARGTITCRGENQPGGMRCWKCRNCLKAKEDQ